MALLLNNEDVERLLTVKDCMEAIENAYREQNAGRAVHFPPDGGRIDVISPSPGEELDRLYVWGAMVGLIRQSGIFAIRMKSDIHYVTEHPDGLRTMEKYCMKPGTFCGLVLLFSIRNGEPLAIINDGLIQHMRVGATNGVAAKYLARKDSETVAIIGAGGMARTHAAAFCAARHIKKIRVFSPTPSHREEFAREMSTKLGVDVQAVHSPQEAIKGADIVSTCTDSLVPVLKGDWVVPGMHLACISNWEFEPKALEKAEVVFRHVKGGAVGVVAGREGEFDKNDPHMANQDGATKYRNVPTLADLIGGVPGRVNDRQVTYFHNVVGSGLQFAAAGAKILQLAKAQGVGREFPTDWFLEKIRD